MDSKLNTGHSLYRHTPAEGRQTVIIPGIARSGTTALAHLLAKHGLQFRATIEAKLEQQPFRDYVESHEWGEAERLISDWDADGPWALKSPSLLLMKRLPQVVERVSSPRVLIMVRDPVAVATRESISIGKPFEDMVDRAIRHLQLAVHAARSLTCPVMLISYEKFLTTPDTAQAAVEFCGLKFDIGKLRDVKANADAIRE